MTERRVKVWDLPTRLFHWGLVVALAGSWWTAENDDLETHILFGYAALALVIFRLVWGVVGSETARFSAFVRGPGAAIAHLRELAAPGPLHRHAGHNALGAYAVLLLLALVLVQTVTGLFSSGGDIFLVAGPLNDLVDTATEGWMETVHEVTFDLILIASAVHVAAILLYAVAKRLDLIGPMMTGSARLPESEAAPRLASPVFGLLLMAGAAGLVWLLSLRG